MEANDKDLGMPLLTMHEDVAHGLRTPLTSVLGFSSTLIDRWHQLDEPARLELLRVVYGEALRMAHSVEHLDRTLYREFAGCHAHSGDLKRPA
jgi:K+-sensing histidine kinase KdpD